MRISLMLLSALLVATPSIAQSTDTDDLQSAIAAADQAVVDAEAIELNVADKAVVDFAMKRTDEGASNAELDGLPLPTNTPFTATGYALELPTAWIIRSASKYSTAFPRT